MAGSSKNCWRNRAAYSASMRKSNSRNSTRLHSLAIPTQSRPRPQLGWRCITAATWAITSKSRRNSRCNPGRCSFKTTTRPLRKTARCTWARLADPSGAGSISTISWQRGPNSLSSSASARAKGKAGTRSCRRVSSCTQPPGSRSGRADNNWPSLIKAEPRPNNWATNHWASSCWRLARRLSLTPPG